MLSKTFSALTALSVTLTGEAAYRNEIIEQDPASIGEVIKTPRPHTYLKPEDLPSSWDYRPLGLLTTDLNQHIPTYCGECVSFLSIINPISLSSFYIRTQDNTYHGLVTVLRN